MAEEILHHLERAGGVISVVGVLVIVAGFVLASLRYALSFRSIGPEASFREFKVGLGRALLLGLEILVLADVIETITVEPTASSLAFLAGLVVLRTFLSWTLTVQVEGRWPWQPAEAE